MRWRMAIALGASLGAAASGERQCDFPVVDGRGLTPEEFHERFAKPGIPVMLQNVMGEWPALREWHWDNLRTAFKDLPLRVGPGPYPTTLMSIDEYLSKAEATLAAGDGEVPGVFQYGQVPTSWSLWAHKDQCVPAVAYLHPNSLPLFDDFATACKVLSSNVQVPEFLVGNASVPVPPNMITHSGILLGFKASGIDFHRHQAAINLVFEGAKEWVMKVDDAVANSMAAVEGDLRSTEQRARPFCEANPEDAVCAGQEKQRAKIADLRTFLKPGQELRLPEAKTRAAQRNYAVGAFASKIGTDQVTEELQEGSQVLRCEQHAGDVVFIPQETQHGVINLENTVAMQMQWNSALYKTRAERLMLYRHLLYHLDPSEPDPDELGDELSKLRDTELRDGGPYERDAIL